MLVVPEIPEKNDEWRKHMKTPTGRDHMTKYWCEWRRGAWALAAIAILTLGVSGAEAEPRWQFVNVTSVLPMGAHAHERLLSGRVNAAVPDPKDLNVMYIATDGGRPTAANGGNPNGIPAIGLPDTGGAGVWKTSNWLDARPNWKPLTDDMPSPSVAPNGLVMSPTNTTILYAAADGPQGCILKTTNSGDNWTAFGQDIFARVKFGGIAVSPVDPNTVYVGVFRPARNTPGGVYKSIDGAKTWTLAGNMQGDVSHVVIDPSNPNTLWAGFVDPDNSRDFPLCALHRICVRAVGNAKHVCRRNAAAR